MNEELEEDDYGWVEEEEIDLFDWQKPEYYRTSPRLSQFDPFSTVDSKIKPSWTAKNVSSFPIDEFKDQEIVIDFVTDKAVWENKHLKFDYQKNKAIHFRVIMIGIKNSTEHVYCFSHRRWQLIDRKSTHGWIDEVTMILNRASRIWMFDPDLFFGVMRFYQPQEQVIMPWRLKARGLSTTLKKKYRCWKQISTLAEMNRIVCPGAFSVVRMQEEGNYEGAIRAMKTRISCLTILFRVALSIGLVIPVAKSRKRKREETTEEEEEATQTITISYEFN